MTSDAQSRNIKEPPDFHQHSSQAPTLIMRHLDVLMKKILARTLIRRMKTWATLIQISTLAHKYSRRKTKTNGPLCQARLLEEWRREYMWEEGRNKTRVESLFRFSYVVIFFTVTSLARGRIIPLYRESSLGNILSFHSSLYYQYICISFPLFIIAVFLFSSISVTLWPFEPVS